MPSVKQKAVHSASTTNLFSGGTTSVAITVFLHGIFNGGDNVVPNNSGNKQPIHLQHPITITFLDANNNPVTTASGNIQYNAVNGNFNGTVALGNVTSRSYVIKIKIEGYLSSQASGIQQITTGTTTTLPSISVIAGDINNDNKVDVLDYNILIGCFGTKVHTSSCTAAPLSTFSGADITDDGTVDGNDYNLYLRELSVQPNSGGTPFPTQKVTPAVILPTPSTSQTTTSKLFGVNVAGADFGTAQYAGSGYSGYGYYHSKGLTLIRLPFTWKKMEPTLNGPLGGDLNKLTDMITTAQSAGEQVFIEPHNYARYNKVPLTPADAPAFANFWKQLAGKYASGYPGLWGYELMNEPHDLAGGCQTWQTLAQAAVTAIRQTDTTHYILVSGYAWQAAKDWATQSSCLSSVHDPVNKMYFSAHEYFDADNSGTHGTPCPPSDIGVQRLQPFFSFLSQNNAKGLVTEYGAAVDACWLTTLDNFMNALNTNPNIVGATYCSGGPYWGGYFMSVEPGGTQDKLQMSTLKKYPSH